MDRCKQSRFSFLGEYLKDPRQIGAIAPSSHFLAEKMMQEADFASCQCIVEYGPGTGAFTKEIVKRKLPQTPLLLIEQDIAFRDRLVEEYSGDPSVHVVYGRAENVEDILALYGLYKADLIVSGLPFTSLPGEVTDAILTKTERVLTTRGKFITFQYTMLKKKLFEEKLWMSQVLFEPRNLPAAFVLVMEHRPGSSVF